MLERLDNRCQHRVRKEEKVLMFYSIVGWIWFITSIYKLTVYFKWLEEKIFNISPQRNDMFEGMEMLIGVTWLSYIHAFKYHTVPHKCT